MKDLERYQELVAAVCEEHDCLNRKQREALGALLSEGKDGYVTVVDYLFIAEEIDLLTRCDLLDLA